MKYKDCICNFKWKYHLMNPSFAKGPLNDVYLASENGIRDPFVLEGWERIKIEKH